MKARANNPSPYLEEQIVLAAHTGLRRGSLFGLRWEIDRSATAIVSAID